MDNNGGVVLYLSLLKSMLYLLEAFLTQLWVFISHLLSTPSFTKTLYYKESSLSAHVLRTCSLLGGEFKTSWWWSSPHVQTMLPYFCGSCDEDQKVSVRREYLQVHNEGVVSLDWMRKRGTTQVRGSKTYHRRILVIVPGMFNRYCEYKTLAETALRVGFRVVVFNQRGCNGTPLASAHLPAPGDPADLRQAIKYIRARYTNHKCTAVSLSYGSVLLLSYLGEYGSSSYLQAAVCISPWYTSVGECKMNNLYDKLLTVKSKFWLSRYYDAFADSVEGFGELFTARTVSELQNKSARILHDYKDMDTYREDNCPLRDADDIATPVLCISSLDDPVVSSDVIPYSLFQVNLNLMLVATSHGGHCGFFSDKHKHQTWTAHLATEYITGVLDFLQKVNK